MAKENSMEPFVVDFSGKVLDCHQADGLDEELIEEIRDRAKKGCELFVFIDTGYSANLDKPFLASDHLNLTGNNPLVGPNNEIGARFPVINDAYAFADGLLAAGEGKLSNCDSLAKLETRVGAGLKPGVVPSDEEIALINSLGADFYCYNLVPATLVAAHAGKKVCALIMPPKMRPIQRFDSI